MTSEDGAKPKDGTKPGPDGARGEPVKWQIAVIAAAVFAVIALILLRSSFALRLRALGIGGHDHSLLRADRPLIWSEHRLRAGLAAMRGLDSEDLNDVRVLLNVVRLTGLSDDAGASYGLESKHISPYGASVAGELPPHALGIEACMVLQDAPTAPTHCPHAVAHLAPAGMPGDVAAMFLLLGKAAVHHVVVVGNGQGALGGLLSSYMKTRGTLGSVVVADPSPDVWNGAPAGAYSQLLTALRRIHVHPRCNHAAFPHPPAYSIDASCLQCACWHPAPISGTTSPQRTCWRPRLPVDLGPCSLRSSSRSRAQRCRTPSCSTARFHSTS